MKVNRGKKFEETVKESFEKIDYVSIDRYPDPMAGYAGFRNICDFGVYFHPFFFYLECKAFSGNTLNFASAITENQWNGLLEKSKIPGVGAGILVWFIDHDQTEFVPIQELSRLKDAGHASLNIKDVIANKVIHFPVPGELKRIYYDYDMITFLNHLVWWYRGYWAGELHG